LERITYNIMKPHAPAPHLGVPFAHAWNDVFVQVFDKHAVEHHPSPEEHIGQLYCVVDVGYDTDGRVSQ
jgi:hypothetical protein